MPELYVFCRETRGAVVGGEHETIRPPLDQCLRENDIVQIRLFQGYREGDPAEQNAVEKDAH